MNRCAIVATHHKTGTAWMNSTFKEICAALNIRYVQTNSAEKLLEADVKAPIVIFSPHSNFRQMPWLIENPEHRILHLIRDPRDVIISGAHYHRAAKEPWLHESSPKFGGMTYQQKINNLPNDHRQYFFEMNNSAKKTIMRMKKWNYALGFSFECKYEDLISDIDMSLFTTIATHLGFSDSELETCRECFWRNSIFGGKTKNDGKQTIHIRSGNAQQWREVFDRQLGRAFVQAFGTTLIELGYEPDNRWVKGLRQRNPVSEIASCENGAENLSAIEE